MQAMLNCPQCRRQLRLPQEVIGSSVCCPMCKSVFIARAASPGQYEGILLADQPPRPQPPVNQPPPASLPSLSLDEETLAPVEAVEDERGERIPLVPIPLADPIPSEPPPPPRSEPRRPRRVPEPERFPTISFALFIQKDPADRLEGRFQAELDPDGLRLWRGKGRILRVPRGVPAGHLAGSRIWVEIDGRRVEMTVVRADGQAAKLAREVAEFINGDRPSVRVKTASAWPIVPLALLPLAVPVIAVCFGDVIGGTLGGVLWGILALILTGLGLLIAAQSSWSGFARGFSCVALAFVGFLFLGVGFIFDFAMQTPTIPPSAWRSFTPPDGKYSILMPGSPYRQSFFNAQQFEIYELQMTRQRLVFSVAYSRIQDVGAQTQHQRMENARVAMMGSIPGGRVLTQRDITLGGINGREWVMLGSNNLRYICRIYADDLNVYVLSCGGYNFKESSADARKFIDSFHINNSAPIGQPPIGEQPKEGRPRDLDRPKDGGPVQPADKPTNSTPLLGDNKTFVWAGFHEKGTRIVGVASDGTVMSWNSESGSRLWSLRPSELLGTIGAVAQSPDGNQLAIVGSTNFGARVLLFNLSTRASKFATPGNQGTVHCVAFSPDGSVLVTGNEDGKARFWELKNARLKVAYPLGEKPIIALAYSPNGKFLAGADTERIIRVIDSKTMKLKALLKGHADPKFFLADKKQILPALAWAPDSKHLVSVGDDSTARTWNAPGSEEVKSMKHGQRLSAGALHPVGRLLVTGAGNGAVRIWETLTGKDRHTVEFPFAVGRWGNVAVASLAFSPDGTRMAVVRQGYVYRWHMNKVIDYKAEDLEALPKK